MLLACPSVLLCLQQQSSQTRESAFGPVKNCSIRFIILTQKTRAAHRYELESRP